MNIQKLIGLFVTITSFVQGVKNCIRFFPSVWAYRGWDYEYSLTILKTALEGALKDQLEFPYTSEKLKRGRAIRSLRIAIGCLDRMTNRKYDTSWYDLIEKKYGKSTFTFVPQDNQAFIFRDVWQTPHDENTLRIIAKERRQIYKHINYLEAQDLEILLKSLKFLQRWWT